MKHNRLCILLLALLLLFTSVPIASAADKVTVDTSTANDGYITVKYVGGKNPGPKMKVVLQKGTEKYTYDLDRTGVAEKFPTQMGNGEYTVQTFENVKADKFAMLGSQKFTVTLKDPNAPFLISTQYVEYENKALTKTKAAELSTAEDVLAKVEEIYGYITSNISYDYEKAKTVRGDYLPNNDNTLTSLKGICFDYSSLFAAMLRLNGIPTRLVIGYVNTGASNEYHAWNEIFVPGQGWVSLAQLQLDGVSWARMDSTFGVPKRYDVINNNDNYQTKYIY